MEENGKVVTVTENVDRDEKLPVDLDQALDVAGKFLNNFKIRRILG